MKLAIIASVAVLALGQTIGFAADKSTSDAAKQPPKVQVQIPKGTAAGLTAGECKTLGCTLVYDTGCPFTIHGVLADNTIRCKCANGSMCVNAND